MAGAEMHPFVTEVMGLRGGQSVLQCYQCGTCSGSCPVLEEMEYGPRRLLYMIQNGMEKEVLSSKDIWRCVSCYSCMNRCPRDIEITILLAELRRLSIQKGYADDKEAEFGQAFTVTLSKHGRLFEPELLTRYLLRTWDVLSMVKMVPLGLKMLAKGKMPILVESIEEPQTLQDAGVIPPESALPSKGRNINRLVNVVNTILGVVASLGNLVSGKKKGEQHG